MIYLAFDFGDGTTCASLYDNSLNEPNVPTIVKGEDEIWTNIAFDKNGENPIVNLRGPKRNYTLLSNWKSKPSKHDDEGWRFRRKTAIDFMRECFKLFLSNNPEFTDGQKWTGMCNGEPCKVIIGVPCDWTDEDVTEYKEMADEAGLPNVEVFKESQAAVLYARKFMAKGLPDEYLEKGVLMIDVGSSTTDFTYMKGLRAAHCGLTLGAKYVEQAFLGDAMSRVGYSYFKPNADAESKEQGRKLRALNLLSVRQWKENFFSAAQQANPDVQTSPLPGSELKVGDEEDGLAYITPEFVNRCLNDDSNGILFSLPHLSDMWKKNGMDGENTWRGHFRNALNCVKNQWEINISELTIFVTGGASRMDFIEDDIKTVYGQNVRYFFGNDRERSFSVVKGLAWAAYATDMIEEKRKTCKQDIQTFVDSLAVSTKIMAMITSISSTISSQLVSKLAYKMRTAPESLNTKRKIEAFASAETKNLLNAIPMKENITSLAKELLKDDKMKSLFSSLQENLGRADISTMMPDFMIGSIDLPENFQINPDLNGFSDVVSNAILWAIAFYLAGATFGASLIIAAIVSFVRSKGPDDVLDSEKIRTAASKIDKKKDEIADKIKIAFAEPHNGVSYCDQLKENLITILTQVKLQELKALEGLFNYDQQ